MKNLTTRIAKTKAIAFLLMTFVLAGSALSQTDTLHLNYYNTSTKLSDSTSKKIDQWVKKITGKHMDISVLAYYNKADFKQFAQERSDELFLVINRKARDLITIQFIGPKKGENYQRSRVDIVYRPTGSLTAEQAKELAEKVKKEEEEKTKQEEKAKKEAEKKEAAEKKALADKQKAAEKEEAKAKKETGKKEPGGEERATDQQDEKAKKEAEKQEEKARKEAEKQAEKEKKEAEKQEAKAKKEAEKKEAAEKAEREKKEKKEKASE